MGDASLLSEFLTFLKDVFLSILRRVVELLLLALDVCCAVALLAALALPWRTLSVASAVGRLANSGDFRESLRANGFLAVCTTVTDCVAVPTGVAALCLPWRTHAGQKSEVTTVAHRPGNQSHAKPMGCRSLSLEIDLLNPWAAACRVLLWTLMGEALRRAVLEALHAIWKQRGDLAAVLPGEVVDAARRAGLVAGARVDVATLRAPEAAHHALYARTLLKRHAPLLRFAVLDEEAERWHHILRVAPSKPP